MTVEPPKPAGVHGLHPAQIVSYANELVAENERLHDLAQELYEELKALRDAVGAEEEEDMESPALARYEREVGE